MNNEVSAVQSGYPDRGRRRRTGLRYLRPPVLVLAFLLFIAVFGPFLAPYDPIDPNPMDTLAPPSWEHLFGTDDYGFDVFSRVLYATRVDFSMSRQWYDPVHG